jgi:hypothetical protein
VYDFLPVMDMLCYLSYTCIHIGEPILYNARIKFCDQLDKGFPSVK